MLNKRGFLALLNWVERTDLWSKELKKKMRERRGRASGKGRKCREDSGKWKARSPPRCPSPPGCALCGAAERQGHLPSGSGALLSLRLSLDFSLQGALGPRWALPVAPPTAWKRFLYSLLGPRLLTLFSGLVAPWAAPPPGAFPSPGWPRCLLSSRHTSGHTVRQPAV